MMSVKKDQMEATARLEAALREKKIRKKIKVLNIR